MSEVPVCISERYERAVRFLPWMAQKQLRAVPVAVRWRDETVFTYRVRTADGWDVVLFHARAARRRQFSGTSLAAAVAAAVGLRPDVESLPLDDLVPASDLSAVEFVFRGIRWRWTLGAASCERLGTEAPRDPAAVLSPDGCLEAFTRDHDLWVRVVATGDERRLTSDGEPCYDYASRPEGNLRWVSERRAGVVPPPALVWSPDSRRILTCRLDQREVPKMHLVEHVTESGRPRVYSYRMALLGDEQRCRISMLVVDVEAGSVQELQHEPQISTAWPPLDTGHAWWDESGRRAYFCQWDWGENPYRLYEHDVITGETREVLCEKTATHVSTNPNMSWMPPLARVLESTRELLWFSERDGWGHLYLYDLETAEVTAQVTCGDWVVREICHVDQAQRLVYFTAGGRESGRDPYLRHLYRVNLDGSQLELLTPEDADHRVTVSPAGTYIVDTYSRVDQPPVSVLRLAGGSLVCELERADITGLARSGWRLPEPFRAVGRDGVTEVFGTVFLPSDLDPRQHYPVIDDIYPGPHVTHAAKAFPDETVDPFEVYDFWMPQAIAELGFVVVQIDGLGTPRRSKAFHDAAYGRIGDAGGLPDHVAAIRKLADTRPYMDLARVGVYGHSAGGYAALRAMLLFPDFYTVGVSSAGAHDGRIQDAELQAKFAGVLGDPDRGYDNVSIAHRLQGKLLLTLGELDDTVLPGSVLAVVDRLVRADKDFDLLLMPGWNHMFMFDRHYVRRLWDFLVRHLLRQEPPSGIHLPADDLLLRVAGMIKPMGS